MIEKISSTISMVFTDEGFTFSNALLVEDEMRLMIDSGAGKIMKSVHPENVDTLLISHHHIDHINGNDYFTHATIYAHPYEKKAMQDPTKTTATFGWGELMDEDIMNYAKNLQGKMKRILEPWNVDKTFSDNDIFHCGKTKIQVLHTPGHTKGHCSFYFPELDFIFTGDICLSKVGPWYGDPDTSIDEFISSIDTIIALKPRTLATGHLKFLVKEKISESLIEYKERIYKREKRIKNFLKKAPATIDEMASRKLIYGLHANTFVLFWEKCMLKKHLERLIHSGEVEIVEDKRFHLL